MCHFPIGILGQVWYLIVLIPDLCTLTYFARSVCRTSLSVVEPIARYKVVSSAKSLTLDLTCSYVCKRENSTKNKAQLNDTRTRSSHRFKQSTCATTSYKDSFFPRTTISHWNHLRSTYTGFLFFFRFCNTPSRGLRAD